MVAGVFDDTMLDLRKCNGIEISKEKFCVAVSMHHKYANRESLKIEDLYGENLLVIKEGWSEYVDKLRKEIKEHHPLIKMIPVNWDYRIPFGLLYSKQPEKKVQSLLKAIEQIKKEDL